MPVFWAIGIVLGPSRHPKDMPFVSGDVRLGCYKPTKRTNSGKISYFEFTIIQISTSLARGQHALLRTTLQTLLLTSGT